MSTIIGIISKKKKIQEGLLEMMVSKLPDRNLNFYKEDYFQIASTELLSETKQYAYCGRIRNSKEPYDLYKKNQSVDDFDGHFIFIDRSNDTIKIYRDALGVEQFYYYFEDDVLYFASEIKGLLCLKEKWTITKDGILQVLALLPALDMHKTPYENIHQLGAGEVLEFKDEITIKQWWTIKKEKVNKSHKEIVEDIYKILSQSILLDYDDHLACLLSGGLDSSIITSLIASKYPTNTYDVTYEHQEKDFKPSSYQTSLDTPYIEAMIEKYKLNHKTICLSQKDLSRYLDEVLILRDLPGMVDIDSSLFLFIASIKDDHTVILSGECADELGGGYPWYRQKELQDTPYFPWTRHVENKNDLLLDQFDICSYIKEKKQFLEKESMKNQMMDLTTKWFMQTLIKRGDVISRACHVDIRMPFASKKLYEYLWNLDEDDYGRDKQLFKEAFKDLLPDIIYQRKKNPYPKTHSPIYLEQVTLLLEEALKDDTSILYRLFKKDKLEALIHTKGASFTYPWYGQLMTGPQLIAFLYTIHQWEKLYPLKLDF